MTPDQDPPTEETASTPFTPSPFSGLSGPPLVGCRSVDNYEKLNRIEEGAYGVVYRARDRQTGEIVALKKLKLENEKNGFPVTSLREIHTLLLAKHPNIVNVKEIVVTKSLSGIFIVMEFVEHDLKSLMENMQTPFLQSEIKTLMLQLLSGVACLHQNWIVHRDLKTSNLLMNNRGQIKIADFGLARRSSLLFAYLEHRCPSRLTRIDYRAPELLLGAKEYSTAIDMWSIGCIFGELVNKEPLLPGKGELDQLKKIFKLVGTPNERIWPGYSELPATKTFSFAKQGFNTLRNRFPYLTESGLNLMSRLLTLDPEKRITAEEALKHPYFTESPLPKDPSLFPTWPSKSAGEKRKTYLSPSAPIAAHGLANGDDEGVGGSTLFGSQMVEPAAGFRLKV
ncbi:Cyclin-dependent kinase 11A [Borealophlyctis nickersoniae]|nr:Cyclin-dependent kinase 11A [Borealophlyctis nickersoniae]